jgi:hypothetical protein
MINTLKEKAEQFKDLIIDEDDKIQLNISTLEDILRIKKEELASAIAFYLEENDLSIDYSIKFGIPNDPDGKKYTEEEYNDYIDKIKNSIKEAGIYFIAHRNTRTLKFYFKNSDLEREESRNSIFNIVKEAGLLEERFGGNNLKGNMGIDNIHINCFYSLNQLINGDIFSK